MNYYLDFDNTLYETAKLTTLMLEATAKGISKKTGKDPKQLLDEAKGSFDSTNDNIFSFASNMAKRYNVDSEEIVGEVKKTIDNGEEIVFDDAKRFLERLKENGDKAHILTYVANGNQEYQMRKLIGSGIMKYIDGTIITTEYKFLLDLNYENGIFIDDDPRDLNGLAAKNPKKVIRMRKPNNKRSVFEISNKQIEEYTSFDDIELEKNKGKDSEPRR